MLRMLDTNFANPEFEPTDEQHRQLLREAFAHVPALNREAQAQLRARIAARRAEILAQLKKR